jgi:ATP-dependent RNA helicase DeaD
MPEAPQRTEPAPVQPPKGSRRTPDAQTRLYLNAGAEMGISEADIVGTILGETGLPRNVVGAVDIRERHLFVDVASEHANSIISKLNRAQIKGRKAKAKVA